MGLGIIISQSVLLFSVLKYIGAAYLVWLGIGALRAEPSHLPGDIEKSPMGTMSPIKAFSIGFLTNLLNPKAMLFFVSLFTIIVSANTEVQHKGFYVLSMSLMLFLWFMMVSIFFTTPKIRDGFYRMGKWFNRITGMALVFLAIRVALSRQN